MDLGFHRRNRPRLRLEPTLDYRSIVAELAVVQASGVTAMAAERIARADPVALSQEAALAVLMLCEPGWVRATLSLGGNFNPPVARKFSAIRS